MKHSETDSNKINSSEGAVLLNENTFEKEELLMTRFSLSDIKDQPNT